MILASIAFVLDNPASFLRVVTVLILMPFMIILNFVAGDMMTRRHRHRMGFIEMGVTAICMGLTLPNMEYFMRPWSILIEIVFGLSLLYLFLLRGEK